MISVAMAERLERAGVRWRPRDGDRFCLRAPGFAGEVFTVAEMVIEVREYPTGTLLAFNGTTEWALDSVQVEQALWLPSEGQLRDLLGGAFHSLKRTPAGHFEVLAGVGPEPTPFAAPTAPDAYAEALLGLIGADESDWPAWRKSHHDLADEDAT